MHLHLTRMAPPAAFSVLYGFWAPNYVAFNGDLIRDLAAQFLALAEKRGATVPLMVGLNGSAKVLRFCTVAEGVLSPATYFPPISTY